MLRSRKPMPKPIPDADKREWKDAMVERYSRITDIDELKRFSLCFLRKSIRVNTLKATVQQVRDALKDWNFTPIPWCAEGFWVEHKEGRLDIGNTPEHALGWYYVQEAASMIPPEVLAPEPGERVLDICAAPGSKTTQLAAMMNNEGVLVANDITSGRLAALGVNLQRCGVSNVIVTQMNAMKNMEFDSILVDAPCSGTGTIRKSLRTLLTWSISATQKCCKLQADVLERAWSMLAKGGTLVYSTCSLEPEEDEGAVSRFLKRHADADCVAFTLKIVRGKPVLEWEGESYDPRVANTLRVWPQDNDTEGFFVAKLVKL